VQIGAANGGERYLDKHFTGMKFIRQCCRAHLERLVSTVEKLNACGHYFEKIIEGKIMGGRQNQRFEMILPAMILSSSDQES
jgi:hypothetical protein